MSGKKKAILIFCIAACVFAVGVYVFNQIYTARHPLVINFDFDPATVDCIEIFNGATGKKHRITNATDVWHIAKDIQAKTYKRDENVKGTSGFTFSTVFFDKNGDAVWSGTINGTNNLVKYHYVYRPDTPLDFAYIQRVINEE